MPSYVRYIIILFGLSLLIFILHIGRTIIVPIYVASLFSWLMVPFSNLLEKRGLSRKAGAVLSIVIIVTLLTLLAWFFITQVRSVSSSMDQMQEKLAEFKRDVFNYASQKINLSKEQLEAFSQRISSAVEGYTSQFGSIASSLFVASILLPMSMYFFMAYRSFYREFLHRLSQRNAVSEIEETIHQETSIVRNYLLGVLAVVAILSVCNVAALTIIGVEYALLFAVVAALLNIVPVIGTIIGSLIPVFYVLIMKDSTWYAIIVALYFWFIQVVESSVITPNIVGKRMGVNPFAVLIAIFVGGAVWGPVGMVLFIPLIAQIKVVCSVVEPLKPFGFVLSDPETDREPGEILRRWRQKIRRKK